MACRLIWATLLAALPTICAAEFSYQTWAVQTDRIDAGVLARMTVPDGNAAIYCGVVLSEETSLYENVAFSGPGFVNVLFSEDLMGPYAPDQWEQTSVKATYQGDTVTLPTFFYDEMGGAGWVSRLPEDHPFMRAMIKGNDITITPELAPPFEMPRSGLSIRLFDLLDHCALAESVGNDVTTQPQSPLEDRAHAQFAATCQGTYQINSDALRQMDVTGDGVDEALADFTSLQCTSGLLAGTTRVACADEMCRQDIYVDGAADPVVLYGVTLEPAPDTVGDIHLLMDRASCEGMGQQDGCKVRMRWRGNTFGTIGIDK